MHLKLTIYQSNSNNIRIKPQTAKGHPQAAFKNQLTKPLTNNCVNSGDG